MEYPTRHLCVYEENTSDLWDIPQYTTRKHCISTPACSIYTMDGINLTF